MVIKTTSTKTVRLQVPLKESVRNAAEEKAQEIGFGSVQEVVRLFIAGFVRGEYTVGFANNQSTQMTKEENSVEKQK